MSEQPSIRDDLAHVLAEWHDRNRNPERWVIEMYESAADRVLASSVIRRIQAEAIREATRVFATSGWVDTFTAGVVDDVSAVQAADRWFNERADRIERGE